MSKNILLSTQETTDTVSDPIAKQSSPHIVTSDKEEKLVEPKVEKKKVRFDEEKLVLSKAEAAAIRKWIKEETIDADEIKASYTLPTFATEFVEQEEKSDDEKKAAAILEQLNPDPSLESPRSRYLSQDRGNSNDGSGLKKETRLDEIAEILNCKIIKRNLQINNSVLDLNVKPGYQNIDNGLLHLAARVKNLTIVEELIALGADVNIKNKDNISPIALACSAGSAEIFKTLAAAGAKIDLLSNSSRNLFHFLCAFSKNNPQDKEERLNIAQFLIDQKLDPQQLDKKSQTPSQLIPQNVDFSEMVELLTKNLLRDTTNFTNTLPEPIVNDPEAQSFQNRSQVTIRA